MSAGVVELSTLPHCWSQEEPDVTRIADADLTSAAAATDLVNGVFIFDGMRGSAEVVKTWQSPFQLDSIYAG